MLKVQPVLEKWKSSRLDTISALRSSAQELQKSHRRNAESEHSSAKASLMGDIVGLGGVLLAPFSGGMSLAAVGLSTFVGVGSYVQKRGSNKEDEACEREIRRNMERILDKDKENTKELKCILEKFELIESELKVFEIGDILGSLEETTITNISIETHNIRSTVIPNQTHHESAIVTIPGLGVSQQIANLNAAMTSAETIVKCTRVTKGIFKGTRTIQQVVSTAKSVNEVSKCAKSLATAKQAAVITVRASQSVLKSTATFASVAKGAEGVVKTAGVVSSATKTARAAVDIVSASGQTVSMAKSVTNAAKAGTLVNSAKGADTTVKTIKNVKQASNTVKTVTQVAVDSDKAIRTTRITSNVSRVTKVSETATKAASVSKVGLAINVVVIPLDIYNLGVASDNLNKSYADVKRIEDMANELTQEMNGIAEEITVKFETIKQLHIELYRVYEDHKIEKIYEYLQLMYEQLEFKLPLR